MSELIAKTAAGRVPKALAAKLARAMREKVVGGGAAAGLGEDVATVMVAQRADTLHDEHLAAESAHKRAQADAKVRAFAAKERAKEEAQHARWEEKAKAERRRCVCVCVRARARAHTCAKTLEGSRVGG